MASSTTSCIHKSFKYDVFLSFRGKDTRKNFVDHLYHALQQRSIYTYKDDKRIKKGKRISDELIKSIEDSRFHIIVFSKNYASSSWCLNELVKIMECQKTTEQTAYPIFYDVEPSEVRRQSGTVGEAFAKHKKEEADNKWREALEEAATLAGWELKNTLDGHEAKLIQKIVEEISLDLRSINFSVDGNLIGMETRINDFVSSLETSFDDVRMIGIKGMGGVGKTTLARAVFNQISIEFEGKSFVENVKQASKSPSSGLKSLQKQILSDVLNDKGITISGVHDGKILMKQRMCGRKVLVVLDDVDHREQLEALAGELDWFKPGSVIIITTRDEQVLVAHRVKLICDVNLLSDEEAICLFNRYAFGRDIPIQGYEELSGQVVRYAAGLPLTITVLGSFLCGKNDLEWKDALERLKTIPLKETLKKLELSYTGLEEDYKEIFLDVARILKGWPKYIAIRVLESCGFHARNGLRVLEQKSLITISDSKYLDMHDHLEEMGKNVVRRLHPDEPNRHSRLWIDAEIKDILANDLGAKATRCIKLQTGKLNPQTVMRGLRKMKKLRFLHVLSQSACGCFHSDWRFDEVSRYFPNALRYLFWDGYPFGCLPNTFLANNLVGLEMPFSRIVQLWEGGERKVLYKLRFLELSYSKLRTLDLGVTPNIEMLSLRGCDDLVELYMPGGCPKLKSLDLSYSKFGTPDLGLTPNLETLMLEGCDNLIELHIPLGCLKLRSLYLSRSKLRNLDLRTTPNLEMLSLEKCIDLVELHIPLGCVKLSSLYLSGSKLRTLELTPNLDTLHLRNCYNLVELHMPVGCQKLRSLDLRSSKFKTIDLGLAPNIEMLSLVDCDDLVELHMPFKFLNLKSLYLNNSQFRTFQLGLTPNLKKLSLLRCNDLVELHMPFECIKLVSLNLSCSKVRILDLGLTPNIKRLNLRGCSHLVELNIPLIGCLKLKFLDLSHSKLRALNLRLTPNLESLDLISCYNLVELHAPAGCLKELVHLNLSGCLRLNSFLFDKQIESLKVVSLVELHLIVESLGICHSDNNLPKFRFICFVREPLSSSIGNLEKIISVGCACTNLESFLGSICGLRRLRKLKLNGNIPEAPKDLDLLLCLEELILSSTEIKHLPNSICMLKKLKFLKLKSCWLLEKLPEDLGRLECLEKLVISECVFLRDIPNSICEMKRLEYLHLPCCIAVEKLPVELGCLKCLKELNIEGTDIRHLPQSIFVLKGLRIVAFAWLLELCGFTSEIQTSKYETFCYI